MKINICLSEKDTIQGYNNIAIDQINNLVNGSVSEILFKQLDSISHSDRGSLLSNILGKIKYNGLLIIEVLDTMSLGKDISNGSVSSKTVSELLQDIVSVQYEFDIMELIGNFPQYYVEHRYSHNYKLILHLRKAIQ
jgi:hypothetical protein